jgi:hypothetical protein
LRSLISLRHCNNHAFAHRLITLINPMTADALN